MESKPILKHRYIAFDQYGNHLRIKRHPRKELMEHHGTRHANKIYIDGPGGRAYHIGYVVAGHWWDVYHISPLFDR